MSARGQNPGHPGLGGEVVGEMMKRSCNYETFWSVLGLLVVFGCSSEGSPRSNSAESNTGASRETDGGSQDTPDAAPAAGVTGLLVSGPVTGGMGTIFSAWSADLAGNG
jgi:hypothetical protein